jgi:glutamyl-tRNA reductase
MNKLSARHTLGEIEQQVLRDMSHSIVNKLLADTTKVLKKAAESGDEELLKSLSELFRLEETI